MMTRAALLRIAAVAAIAIVIAITYERAEEPVPVAADSAHRGKAQLPRSVPPTSVARPNPEAGATANDPFAPRGWQEAVRLVQPAPVVALPAAVVPATPPVAEVPVAPALPYVFMGQFDDGGRQVVYLSRNDQTFVITPGETIEGIYKVLTMNPGQIEFEHIPTGTKQVLTIPASNT